MSQYSKLLSSMIDFLTDKKERKIETKTKALIRIKEKYGSNVSIQEGYFDRTVWKVFNKQGNIIGEEEKLYHY